MFLMRARPLPRKPALLDFASAFSPRVEDTAAGTVVMDIEGLDRLFGSTVELGQRLQDYASSLGTAIHVGIASNPDAAVCAARGWPGITILERKTEAERLKDLDISLLPLDPDTHATLLRWGVRTFGVSGQTPVKRTFRQTRTAGSSSAPVGAGTCIKATSSS